MKSIVIASIVTVFAYGAWGQSVDAKPEFDVASVRPSAPFDPGKGFRRMGPDGGPGTRDPGRFTCDHCPLTMIIQRAFDIKQYQLSAPDWMSSAMFDISAKVPEGATKEQFLLMQQSLLADRFKLTFHREKKEMAIYDLVVGKNGPKMKESLEVPETKDATKDGDPPPPPSPMVAVKIGRDKDGNPTLPPGHKGALIMFMNGRARMVANNESMDQLVTMLSNQLGRPVTNATGLKGTYDVALTFAPESMGGRGMLGIGPPPPPPPGGGSVGGGPLAAAPDDTAPTLLGAVQEQLGLKLESKKGSIDLLVIDHMEKAPTEN